MAWSDDVIECTYFLGTRGGASLWLFWKRGGGGGWEGLWDVVREDAYVIEGLGLEMWRFWGGDRKEEVVLRILEEVGRNESDAELYI